jgi:hypothetical protein
MHINKGSKQYLLQQTRSSFLQHICNICKSSVQFVLILDGVAKYRTDSAKPDMIFYRFGSKWNRLLFYARQITRILNDARMYCDNVIQRNILAR